MYSLKSRLWDADVVWIYLKIGDVFNDSLIWQPYLDCNIDPSDFEYWGDSCLLALLKPLRHVLSIHGLGYSMWGHNWMYVTMIIEHLNHHRRLVLFQQWCFLLHSTMPSSLWTWRYESRGARYRINRGMAAIGFRAGQFPTWDNTIIGYI
jgi:hypothetical protein